jgi:hypothetical protein
MPLVITEQHGPVRHVVLNRPDKRNAINGDLIAELGDALRAAAADSASHCVVIRGAGLMFSSGMDLEALANLAENPDTLRAFRKVILDVWNLCEEMAKPTVCEMKTKPVTKVSYDSQPHDPAYGVYMVMMYAAYYELADAMTRGSRCRSPRRTC